MKRVFKISDTAAAQSQLLSNLHRHPSKPKFVTPLFFTLPKSSFYRLYGELGVTTSHFPLPTKIPGNVINLFIEKLSQAGSRPKPRADLIQKVTMFRDEIVKAVDCLEDVSKVLDEEDSWLLDSCKNYKMSSPAKASQDNAFLELLKKLNDLPNLAMEVFNWRRKKSEQGYPMIPEEYASGITIAGRLKNVDLALELFAEAANKSLKTTSTYNALMSAYTYNGLADKCQLVFRDLKRERGSKPSIVTYNILISSFGRLMLIDHMETTFQEIRNLNLSPNLSTYNNLIAAYVTAWMWGSMERTFQLLKAGPIMPDVNTYMLMLRGYAHSGNLEQMEQTYQMIKHHVDEKETPLIRAMICAYCKSSDKDRTKKVEELLKLIPKNEYRPWLNVLIIRLYAQENRLECMESSINEAFEHNTSILTLNIMRCIISTYFRYNAVDKLANFIKRAECAGWRICRSLYHCKMVMYGSQKRLEEMENVLNELDSSNMNCTKKTFTILYKAYSICGKRHKVEQVAGLMYKHGYEIPLDGNPS